jgi:two-component system chemotaxis response regulator CheY
VARLVVEHDLRALGAEVLTADDGLRGLRLLVDELLNLDLLVTDLQMPQMDGLTLIRVIRAEGGERELPILVLTGTLSADSASRLAAAGATVVEKSEGPAAVVAAAATILAERGWFAPRTTPVAALLLHRASPAPEAPSELELEDATPGAVKRE